MKAIPQQVKFERVLGAQDIPFSSLWRDDWVGAGIVMTGTWIQSARQSWAPLLRSVVGGIAILLVGLTYCRAGIGRCPRSW